MEDETEFEWQGKLYDVSSISKTMDGYKIVCEHDSLEELLLTLLKSAQGGEKNRGQTKGSPQPQFLSSIMGIQPAITSSIVAGQTQFLQSSYPTIRPEVLSPPPEFFR